MLRCIFLLFVLMSASTNAALKCEVDLQYGILVNGEQIRILVEDRTVYQINGQEQLIVYGDWIDLDEQQKQQVAELSKGIRYAVPKMILLATEGVELAISTVEHVYLGLVGNEHKSVERLQGALERVNERVKKKFLHSGNNYYIGPRSLENVDELVDQKLETEIERALNTSVGGILSAIGGLASNGDATMEQRMEELSERLENMGEEIERQVEPQAVILRKKARWFCNKLQRLNQVEDELRMSISELKPYNVIVTGMIESHG